jgi:hypothetical protein
MIRERAGCDLPSCKAISGNGAGLWRSVIAPRPSRGFTILGWANRMEEQRSPAQDSPPMTVELKSSLVTSLEAAAAQAGLALLSAVAGSDFHGRPTAVFRLGLPGSEAAGRALRLELSEAFVFDKLHLLPAMTAHLAAEARRLRNPRPECYVTLGGLPVAFGQFQWPFHRSTSGADTYILHGSSPGRRRCAQPACQDRRLGDADLC